MPLPKAALAGKKRGANEVCNLEKDRPGPLKKEQANVCLPDSLLPQTESV